MTNATSSVCLGRGNRDGPTISLESQCFFQTLAVSFLTPAFFPGDFARRLLGILGVPCAPAQTNLPCHAHQQAEFLGGKSLKRVVKPSLQPS